jgi:hypothetical protein
VLLGVYEEEWSVGCKRRAKKMNPEMVGPRYGTVRCTGAGSVRVARLFGIETDVYEETIKVRTEK